MLELSEIVRARDTADRSQTHALVAALARPGLDDALRGEIEQALDFLDDERAEAPLRALVVDATQPSIVRESAAGVLANMRSSGWPRDADLASALGGDDAVLRRIAIRSLDRRHEARLAPILDDPSHPDHAAAIDALWFGFDHPRFVRRCVRALEHPDADVRRAGASSLLFTEPLVAIEPLLSALDDPDAGVAEAAMNTLTYVESCRVLSGLHDFAARTPDAERRSWAERRAWHVVHDLAFTLRCPGGDHPRVRAWLEPVWRWVEPALAEIDADPVGAPTEVPRIVVPACASSETFGARYAGVDRPWDELVTELTLCDWSAVPEPARDALAATLAEWPDTYVRQHAPTALAVWRDTARLVALLDDPCPAIATSACWRLGQLGPAPRAARAVRDRYEALPFGTWKSEALTAYVAIARPEAWQPLVRDVLRDDDGDESLKVTAAHALARSDAMSVASEALALLSGPPAVRWDLHAALVDLARELQLPTPDLGHLDRADDRWVVEALARLELSRA